MQADALFRCHKGQGIDIEYRQWNLLREDISLPTAVLLSDNIEHNLRWMQQFIDRYHVKLAPHGKTTMSPKLFHKQIESGAWAITLATVHQVQVAYAAGIRRIIMANQLIGRTNMAIIKQLIDNDPDFDFYCLIDSSMNIEQLGQYFGQTRGRALQVLLEIGVDQGRTGIRNDNDENVMMNTLQQYEDSLALAGVELFEGILIDEQSVRSMLQRTVACLQRLQNDERFFRSPPILSGAGSSWYDIVADEFSHVNCPVDIVLRPGCYLTHDKGIYDSAQTRILEQNSIAREISGQGALRPALQIWAYVQSLPEANRAIIAFGKRDVAFDAGFPIPILHYRTKWLKPNEIDARHYRIVKMMDQHAFLDCPLDHCLMIGDMLGFDISHPCLTFDKWRKVLVIDQDYSIVDVLDTYF
jgi:D-serine dehydratase